MTETQIAVGVFGAAGRMGAEVCRAVDAAPTWSWSPGWTSATTVRPPRRRG